MCTDAGIAKYNANNFKVFSTANGLPDNTVFEAIEDPVGRIWFRTLANKIGYIFNDSVFDIGANSAINSFVLEGKIISFAFDKNGDLLLGRQNTSVCSFLKISSPFRSIDVKELTTKLNNKCGTDVLILSNNKVVFTEARNSSYGTKYKINIVNASLDLIQTDSISHKETFPVSHFCLVKNNLFYNTKNLITKYDLKAKTKQTVTEPFLMIALNTYKDSILLIGSLNNGVYEYNTKDFGKSSGNFLGHISASFITKDLQNGLWISSLESGVYYYGSDEMLRYKLVNEDGNSIASMVFRDKNSFWVGLNNGTVYEFDFPASKKLASSVIFGKNKDELKTSEGLTILLPIAKNKLFISSRYSNLLYHKTEKTEKFEFLKLLKAVKSAVKFNEKLYICTVSEVYETDTVFSVIKYLGSINDRLSGIASNGKDLYVAGLKGLYRYFSATHSFERDVRFNDRVEALKEKNGTIFLATKDNGLLILKGNTIDTVSEKHGLISNICNSILIHGDEIWVVSNRGISKISDLNNGKYHVFNYSLDYFVDPIDIKELCRIDDFLLFYSGNFIYAFNTNNGRSSEKCFIKEVVVNGERKDPNSKIILKYNSSDIKISFEALFYNLKGKIAYRYNYGRGWIYTGEPSVDLVALPSGNYTFQVEALNVNNDWVGSSNNVIITVEKPYWQTLGFILLLILFTTMLLSAFLFAINRRQLTQEKKKNQLNIKMIELESKAVRSLMNPHFIFNSLNALQRFILESDLQNAEKYLIKFSKLLRKLLESGAVDKISLAYEIDILNKYLEIEKLRFDDSFDVSIVSDVDNAREVYIPFMLIQPFIENAIWHGLIPKNGIKQLSVMFSRVDENRLMCVIDDNGVGRVAGQAKKDPLKSRSLALDLIRQRLELYTRSTELNCFFKIIDKEDSELKSLGTRIEIVLPIIK
jgi:hypothetical protein